MTSQFGHPQGWRGAIIGHLMAIKNQPMNRLAVDMLGVVSGDAVLEVGFGPGKAIALVVNSTPAAFIGGIDRSAVMVRQAKRRNRASIDVGTVELHEASVSKIPFGDGRFDRAMAINSFHHWDDHGRALAELKRVLKPGGLLLLCLRMQLERPRLGSAPGLSDQELAQAQSALSAAGFTDLTSTEHEVGRRVVCLTGRVVR